MTGAHPVGKRTFRDAGVGPPGDNWDRMDRGPGVSMSGRLIA